MKHHVEFVNGRPVVQESAWALIVNDQLWVTLLCTPEKVDYLALGFLASEGVIAGLDDVAALEISAGDAGAGNAVLVELRQEEVVLPTRRTITSGCTGGVTFDLAGGFRPLNSHQTITPGQVFELMGAMQKGAVKYRETRGLHCSALADQEGILVLAEDVGRHNTLDKIRGECLARGVSTKNRFLLTTGRVSSEMLHKAVKMRTPIVISRTSPTDLSLQAARRLNITLIGYVRGRRMRVYAGRERVITEGLIPCDT